MVDHVVLDEVDQMLDLGFSEAVEEILSHAYASEISIRDLWLFFHFFCSTKPHLDREKKPQTLLFSATCPHWVERTARKYMTPSTTVRVDTIGSSTIRTATTVEHLAIRCNFSELQACIGRCSLWFVDDASVYCRKSLHLLQNLSNIFVYVGD